MTNPQSVKTYIENGRTKYEATRPGDIIRIFAMRGCDLKSEHGKTTRTWSAWIDGEYAGIVMAADCCPGFAYGFTAKP